MVVIRGTILKAFLVFSTLLAVAVMARDPIMCEMKRPNGNPPCDYKRNCPKDYECSNIECLPEDLSFKVCVHKCTTAADCPRGRYVPGTCVDMFNQGMLCQPYRYPCSRAICPDSGFVGSSSSDSSDSGSDSSDSSQTRKRGSGRRDT